MPDTLANLQSAIDRLEIAIRDLRSELVRKDVYEAHRAALLADVAAVRLEVAEVEKAQEKAEERRASDRRLFFSAIAAPIIVAIVLVFVMTQIGGVQ